LGVWGARAPGSVLVSVVAASFVDASTTAGDGASRVYICVASYAKGARVVRRTHVKNGADDGVE